MEQTILIAVDHSAEAEYAVKFYLDRIHRPGNKVLLAHCSELPELSINKARDSHMSPGVLANMWKEEEARNKVLEEKLKGILKEKKVPGVLRTLMGKPGEALCRLAEEEKISVIIMGTRGMGKVRRTILGSVTDYLVNHAICPVLVCRDPNEIMRKRNLSGQKKHHPSGEAINNFTSQLRQRFASGGKGRAGSTGSDKDAADKEKKEGATAAKETK